jgi:hypothetical protein
LGGILTGAFGLSAPFWVNALSNLGVVGALAAWRGKPEQMSALPVERFGSAIRTGLRHARHNPDLAATLIRAVAFFLFGSAYWALLPLVTQSQMGGGPSLYGALLGIIGGSAVIGALLIPRLEERLGGDGIVICGTAGTALALALFGVAESWGTAVAASAVAGVSWIAVVASLNVSAQLALPNWVRGRGLAIYVSVFYGALTLGSVLWGAVADLVGLSAANLLAAAGLMLGIPATAAWKLHTGAQLDLTPSMNGPTAQSSRGLGGRRGPVLVTMEYLIDPSDRDAFLAAVEKLGQERKRNGAYAWGVFEDPAKDGRFIEGFLVESWLDHLRQEERGTVRGGDLQKAAAAFVPGGEPKVTYLIAAGRDQSFPARHKRMWHRALRAAHRNS